jgi:3',5'-cyclic AMP phosphodiesterase CpdA
MRDRRNKKVESFNIGLVADAQYAQKDPNIGRYYRNALNKLKSYQNAFITARTDFIVHLGDFIDHADTPPEGEMLIREAMEALECGGIPVHYLMGNHDIGSVPAERLAKLWRYPNGSMYYAFIHKAVKFILLNTNYNRNGIMYRPDEIVWNDVYINQEQIDWLARELAESEEERIIIFSHALLDDFADPHAVKNGADVRAVLESSNKQIVVFQGHMHRGRESETGGIPYYTLKATVDGETDFCYWLLTISCQDITAREFTNAGERNIVIR